MYSRLTTEGRSVTWFVCKVIAWGSAITLGITGIVAAGESIGAPFPARWQCATTSSPSRTVMATPGYYASPSAQTPSFATLQFHLHPIPVQHSYHLRTYAPVYFFSRQALPLPFRLMSTGYRTQPYLSPGYRYWNCDSMYPVGQSFKPFSVAPCKEFRATRR